MIRKTKEIFPLYIHPRASTWASALRASTRFFSLCGRIRMTKDMEHFWLTHHSELTTQYYYLAFRFGFFAFRIIVVFLFLFRFFLILAEIAQFFRQHDEPFLHAVINGIGLK